jgi:sugar lactone lactonase YvrE
VVPGAEPEVYAEGFTNVTDVAFGPDGSLYVLEIATNGLLSEDPTGALIRVRPDGSRETIASEGLVTPTGLAVGHRGEFYVSNRARSPARVRSCVWGTATAGSAR